jgi:hypothetical protein
MKATSSMIVKKNKVESEKNMAMESDGRMG